MQQSTAAVTFKCSISWRLIEKQNTLSSCIQPGVGMKMFHSSLANSLNNIHTAERVDPLVGAEGPPGPTATATSSNIQMVNFIPK